MNGRHYRSQPPQHLVPAEPQSKPSSAGRCAAASLVRVCRLLRGLFKTQCKTTLCSSAAQLLLSHASNLEGARPTGQDSERERVRLRWPLVDIIKCTHVRLANGRRAQRRWRRRRRRRQRDNLPAVRSFGRWADGLLPLLRLRLHTICCVCCWRVLQRYACTRFIGSLAMIKMPPPSELNFSSLTSTGVVRMFKIYSFCRVDNNDFSVV